MDEVLQLRSEQHNLKKARAFADKLLPQEPISMVKKYLEQKDRPSKEQVVDSRKSRFTKPALPEKADDTLSYMCSCKGKCATKRCICKLNKALCTSGCACSTEKCVNRN